jgi:hypothetical protein
MSHDDSTPPALDDTPLMDRMWDGLVAWLRGTFVVIGTAVAVAGTLGWPRRAAAALTGTQLWFLAAQALACSAFIARSGRSLCRHGPGALAVAFLTGVPASFAVLMSLEWRHPSEPLATWRSLIAGSVQLAALEAAPVGYLLWLLGQRAPSP